MWPWGHLAVAYLLYSAFVRLEGRRIAGGLAVFALAFGSQFPDLIDKPLGWSLGVLPGGRTLAHSVFFAALVAVLVYAVAARYGRREMAAAFGIGYGVHLGTDIPPSVLFGDPGGLRFLLWPAVEQPAYGEVDSILAGFLRYSMGGYEWFQLGLFFLAVFVWFRDGRPGLAYARHQVERLDPIGR